MGIFSGVLLVSDYDNTLVYTTGALREGCRKLPELSVKNRQALEYFTAEGGRFTVATGRVLVTFAPLAQDLPINAPCVLYNGAALYDFPTGTYLETAPLPECCREQGQKALEQVPEAAVEACHMEGMIYLVHPNETSRRHRLLTQVAMTVAPSLPEVPMPLGKLLFEGDHEILTRVEEMFRREGWADSYELIFSNRELLELTARGASKGGMVARLADRLGIDRRHVYCVGDEANDLSMLDFAQEGFAPANCVDAVRGSGATIVADAREDALADVMARLERKYAH